ncbi:MULTISPECIES: FitA-like ribbon-helix-helix domain-containing protein [unclassified Nocardiopsis]|uniref:FitA-like ribbon-helix-helix domain-containing protein n=1 Tax=Nocardiopsis TaxID=2013 RepID=UPI00387ADD7D
MTALTIRDLPDEDVKELKVRAAKAGQSLQAYVRTIIAREVSKPTLADAVEAARRTAQSDVTVSDVLSAIDEGRAGR